MATWVLTRLIRGNVNQPAGVQSCTSGSRAASATPHVASLSSPQRSRPHSYRVPSRRRVAEGPIHLRAGTVLPHEWQIQISLIYMWRAALRIRLIHQYMQQGQRRKWRRPSRRSMNRLQVLFQLTYRFASTQQGSLRLRTILLRRRRCSQKTTQTWFSQEQAFL
jgi:hypothetical protein